MRDKRTTLARPQLSLTLGCNSAGQTILQQRYMAYPLSVSPLFRREEIRREENSAGVCAQRAYLYRMNTSPGLLAGDDIEVSIQLATKSQLYLADQSALKVHSMPDADSYSTVRYNVRLEAGSMLEFLPEPLILFEDADLEQTVDIEMHDEAGLCWGEIVLPGRLARDEKYQFRRYLNKTKVCSLEGTLWFAEAMNLTGKGNLLARSPLFASAPVLGTLILALPKSVATAQGLKTLGDRIDKIGTDLPSLDLASSVLPGDRGLLIRAMSKTTREIQVGFKQVLNCGRSLQGQNPLPYGL